MNKLIATIDFIARMIFTTFLILVAIMFVGIGVYIGWIITAKITLNTLYRGIILALQIIIAFSGAWIIFRK